MVWGQGCPGTPHLPALTLLSRNRAGFGKWHACVQCLLLIPLESGANAQRGMTTTHGVSRSLGRIPRLQRTLSRFETGDMLTTCRKYHMAACFGVKEEASMFRAGSRTNFRTSASDVDDGLLTCDLVVHPLTIWLHYSGSRRRGRQCRPHLSLPIFVPSNLATSMGS